MPDQDIIAPISGVDYLTYEQANIIANYEKLWIEVVFWMRNFFRSSLEDQPDLTSVTTRIFQKLNLDFYNEFSKYYGEEQARQFLDIFSRLVASNWQLVNSYKNKDQAAIDTSTRQWYQIADELAVFLAGVNSHWDVNQLKTMLYEYIKLKIQEIMAFLEGNYEQEINIFDDLENQAIKIGSYMASGIIADQARPHMKTWAEQYLFRH